MQVISRLDAKAQGLKAYFTEKPCRHGHIAHRYCGDGKCSECVTARASAWKKENPEAEKISYRKNKEKRIASNKKWNTENPEKVTEYKRVWADKNREAINEKSRLTRPSRAKEVPIVECHRVVSRAKARDLSIPYYYTGKPCKHGHFSDRFTSTAICIECNRLNSEKIRKEQPDRQKKYLPAAYEAVKLRRSTDPEFKLATKMREMVVRVMKFTMEVKTTKTFELLGYFPADFKAHIESLFVPGMTWANHGEWHIDHVIPLSVLIRRGVSSPAVINALSNLQPLWAEDNQRKSARIQ